MSEFVSIRLVSSFHRDVRFAKNKQKNTGLFQKQKGTGSNKPQIPNTDDGGELRFQFQPRDSVWTFQFVISITKQQEMFN
jgi:hypothetical protein